MAKAIDHDNEDEDGGDEDVPPFSLGRVLKKEGFLFNFLVDAVVQYNQKYKGDRVDQY